MGKDKTFIENANAKGQEISAVGIIKKTHLPKYHKGHIEIVSINPIEGGVEVFAKAWDKDGKPIGFADGTVEIERFRIFNPPLLVPDGTFTTQIDPLTGQEYKVSNFKKDPKEALLQVLDHTLSVSRNNQVFDSKIIVKGKIGHTTDTFYSTAGGDGHVYKDDSSSWSTTRGAASGATVEKTNTTFRPGYTNYNGTEYVLFRGFLPFDTSALDNAANISSAVLSIYGTALTDNGGEVAFVETTQASGSDLALDDYSKITTTEITSRFDITSWSTSGYNDMPLNATGLAFISLTDYTKIGGRVTDDIDNNTPALNLPNTVVGNASEQTGTTNDPKLVITYTVGTDYTSTLNDSQTIAETIAKSTTRILSDSQTAVSAIARDITKILTESALTAVSSVEVSFLYFKTLTETALTATETLLKNITRSLSDSQSISSAIEAVRNRFIAVSDAITITEAAIGRGFTRILSDTKTISEQFFKFKNGINTLWTKVARAVGSWTKQQV